MGGRERAEWREKGRGKDGGKRSRGKDLGKNEGGGMAGRTEGKGQGRKRKRRDIKKREGDQMR